MNKSNINNQLNCPSKYLQKPGFKVIERSKGHIKKDIEIVNSSIIFLLKGEISLTYNDNINKKLSAGNFVFLPSDCTLCLTVLEDFKMIRCWFDIELMLCDYFKLDMLEPYINNAESDFYPLPMDECITDFLDLIEKYLNKDFLCSCFYKYKHQELFHLLRAFYGKAELATFFAQVLGKDKFFKNAVLKYYPNVQNVAELADKMNYSLSGFRKKFDRSFGQSAFGWLQGKRSNAILQDIREGILSNKEIIDKYDFSSDARFYEFCKRLYRRTPSQIRKNVMQDYNP